MADSKITALTSISTSTDPAVDPLVIVDVSDTSMAATGTTKKVTLNQLLEAGGTATLASAPITGNLTVDPSTFVVDSSADKVGVGTTSLSGEKLTVAGNISANAWIGRSNIAAPTGDCSIFRSADNTLAFGIASSTAMTLNSTGLGIGASPTSLLHISGPSPLFNIQSNSATLATTASLVFTMSSSSTSKGAEIIAERTGAGAASALRFHTNDTLGISNERMRITDTGNVGIGVTPAGTGGCLQLKSGITFPATQVASSDVNTLDDYEEGTWTGTLKGSVSDPTIPVTATGAYTKVGRLVTVTIRYINVVTTGASGDVTITGLPFSGAENSAGSAIAFSMFTTSTTLACWNNGTTIAFYVSGAFTPATHSAGVSRSVTVTITYYV